MSEIAVPVGVDPKDEPTEDAAPCCPVCHGDPIEGKPQFGCYERKPTEHELYDEKRQDVPAALKGIALAYHVCDNPDCRASFTWPQPPPTSYALEPGALPVSEADLAAIAQLQRSGHLTLGGQ